MLYPTLEQHHRLRWVFRLFLQARDPVEPAPQPQQRKTRRPWRILARILVPFEPQHVDVGSERLELRAVAVAYDAPLHEIRVVKRILWATAGRAIHADIEMMRSLRQVIPPLRRVVAAVWTWTHINATLLYRLRLRKTTNAKPLSTIITPVKPFATILAEPDCLRLELERIIATVIRGVRALTVVSIPLRLLLHVGLLCHGVIIASVRLSLLLSSR